MRRVIGIVSLVVLAACDVVSGRAALAPPERLVIGKSDTVLVNSRAPVQLPVRVLDSAGHELTAAGLRFARTSGDSVAVSGLGRVTCARRGDAELRVSLGALSRRFVLMCRPVRGFRFVYHDGLPLVVGGEPRELDLAAVGVDGEPVNVFAATVTVEDSSVAVLHGLTVHPRAEGSTSVDVDIGDCEWSTNVTVRDPVRDPSELRRREQIFHVPSLRLVDGERRAWRLPRGEYRVGLVGPTAPDGASLLLGHTAMNCVRWMGEGQDLHCAALTGAAIEVRNPRPPGSGGELTATLFAERMDLPSLARSERPRGKPRDQAKRNCPMVR